MPHVGISTVRLVARSLYISVSMILSALAQTDAEQIISRTSVVLSTDEVKQLSGVGAQSPSSLDKIELSDLTYRSDGLKVKGLMAAPKLPGRYPAIVASRGGSGDFGAWDHIKFIRYMSLLAESGYVVIASQYRGNAGGEGHEEWGGADVDDVMNLLPILEREPKVDASRIGIWGVSRGGLMTFKALTRSSRFKAAVLVSSVYDIRDTSFRSDAKELETMWSEMVPGWNTDRNAAMRARSPIVWANQINRDTPLLLLHGTGDRRSDAGSQVLPMASELYKLRQPFRLVLFEGAEHDIPDYAEERDRMTLAWFNDYLRDGKRWPSLIPHGH